MYNTVTSTTRQADSLSITASEMLTTSRVPSISVTTSFLDGMDRPTSFNQLSANLNASPSSQYDDDDEEYFVRSQVGSFREAHTTSPHEDFPSTDTPTSEHTYAGYDSLLTTRTTTRTRHRGDDNSDNRTSQNRPVPTRLIL